MTTKALTALRNQAGVDLEATKAAAREVGAKLDEWTSRQRALLAERVRRKEEAVPRRRSRDGLPVVR